jgi:hypothetical protein
MRIRKVRFDQDTEKALQEVCRATGISVSLALKRGIRALRSGLAATTSSSPFEIYETIDLGPGGYAKASARNAKSAVIDVLRRTCRS